MKKGQAAMEFLMTYGWAILVVLAAIGALAYFGVLSPQNLLPSSCTVGAGFGCDSAKAASENNNYGDTGTIEMSLRNNIGEDLSSVSIAFEGDIDCNDFAATLGLASGSASGLDSATNIYDWTSSGAACSDGTGCAVTAGDEVSNGKQMMHVVFTGCTDPQTGDDLSGTVSVDFEITYQKSSESVDHTVEGHASLKVE
ncbi:MAG: hypothetical protein KKG59_05550 [Nanoarchaeota archaeon]|nr:hypothetical protein [Nanoarchaeota archaeon]